MRRGVKRFLTMWSKPRQIEKLSVPQCERDALAQLATARGETPEATLERFTPAQLRQMPDMPWCIPDLRRAKFCAAGIDPDGTPYVSLANGRVFYGHLSRRNHRRIYSYVSDVISPLVTEDTFLLAMDVVKRYIAYRDDAELPARSAGARLVEAGAYIGHKTLKYVDKVVGHDGRVLAIEMMPENAALLRRNIEANALTDCTTIVEAGVWNAAGQIQAQGMGRQRNSLVRIDTLDTEVKRSVRTDTLDNFLDAWGEPLIDLIVLTVNGAEVEALQGLVRWRDRVKAVRVYAGYARAGVPTQPECVQIFQEWGFTIVPQRVDHVVLGVNPRFAHGKAGREHAA
jgi:FkbM family methyltransferase